MIQIRRIDRPLFPGGTWVDGTVGEFQFNALVFREHAVKPEFELYDSRISKLWIYCQGVVFNWDRGPDVEPATEEVQDIVVRLCSELADQVCIDVGDRIRLVEMNHPDPLPVGSLGTVTAIHDHRDWLQVEVDWDCGRQQMLSVPPERLERLEFESQ